MLQIKGLQKTSLIDFPNKIVCVVFLGGCNFKCGFCHNKDLVLDSDKMETIEKDEFFDFLDRRRGKLDGVVICGGEPCFSDGLVEFIERVKAKKFFVKLDTNGSFPDILRYLISNELIDYVAMDIKYKFSKYGEFRESVLESIKLIIESGVEHEFRTTVVPGVLSREDLISIAKFICNGKRYYLQQFRNKSCLDENFCGVEAFSKEKLEEFARDCGKYVECYVRG